MRVFVLLFNAGTENEGIHTIRIGDRNKVLMFESEDDANRFALMLEAQDFPPPSVEEIDSEERRGELVKLYPNAIAVEMDGQGEIDRLFFVSRALRSKR